MKKGTYTPASTMLCTAQQALDVINAETDVRLTTAIIEAKIVMRSSEIQRMLRSNFIQTVVVDEYYDAPAYDDDVIILINRPIISVQSIYERSGITDDWSTTITASDTYVNNGYWIKDTGKGWIQLWSPLNMIYPNYGTDGAGLEEAYKISYTFGYATVEAWIQELCAFMVARDILLFQMLYDTDCAKIQQSIRDTRGSIKKDIDALMVEVKKKRRIGVSVL